MKRVHLLAVGVCLLLARPGWADVAAEGIGKGGRAESKEGDAPSSGRPFHGEVARPPRLGSGKERPVLHLITRYLLEGEFALMSKNFPGHTMETQRTLHLRLMEWGPWFLDTRYEEELLFGFALDQVNHTFDYVKLGRRLGPVDLSVFWNHTCNNVVFGRGVNKIHWNDMGFELSTDATPGAQRIHPAHLRLRAASMFLLADAEYSWTLRAEGHVRHVDPDGASPYANLFVDVVGDPGRVTVAPILELGVTIPVGPALALEPFFRVERRRDALESPGKSDTWIFVGMKLVHRGDERDEKGPKRSEARNPVDIQAGYATRLMQEEVGYVSNVAFRLHFPDLLPRARAYVEVHNGINTPPENMFPNFVILSGGPTVEGEWGSARIRASYRYRERRAVGSHWFGPTLKVVHGVTVEVEPGDGLSGAHKINPFSGRFRWGVFATYYPFSLAFPYQFEMGCRAQVHLFRVREIPFRFVSEGKHFVGSENRSLTGISAEVSMTLPGLAGDFRFFLRLERAIDPFRLGKGHHYFLGFELLY
ncbi:MAG: hypothetical protein ACYS47_04305 [Planctomycetota bacterium]|jgi:hypothetical protein